MDSIILTPIGCRPQWVTRDWDRGPRLSALLLDQMDTATELLTRFVSARVTAPIPSTSVVTDQSSMKDMRGDHRRIDIAMVQ